MIILFMIVFLCVSLCGMMWVNFVAFLWTVLSCWFVLYAAAPYTSFHRFGVE